MSTALENSRPCHRAELGKNKAQKQARLSLVVTIIGIIVLLYPVVATLVENYRQSGAVEVYTDSIQEFSPEELTTSVDNARQWNQINQGRPLLDPWLARVSEDNEAYQNYRAQLNLIEIMGRVSIPSINSDLPIYHGTTEEVLKKGIGHMFGSGLPVGGTSTHSVLTGHTGLTTSTLWDNLTRVQIGDAVYLDVHGERMKYEVHSIDIVLSEETSSLGIQPGKDLITLITCTPYSVNSHRLLVHAERVALEETEDKQIFSTIRTPWQPWMTWILVGVGVVIFWMVMEWWFKKRKTTLGAVERQES
ncbi:class C sortase [Corynebacterium kutscheri]|uniref:class C sortase n=1 Tax=Corynebacterium kutscheri TaxID=35755 RepID=UPI0037C17A93